MTEEWKPVSGYEERYEVSSLGRVRTSSRTGFHPKNKHGKAHIFKVSQRLKAISKDRYGYGTTSVSDGTLKKTVTVHTLVAKTFLLSSWFPGATVNHKDGNKLNNEVGNLEWVSMRDNIRHAWKFLGRVSLAGKDVAHNRKLSEKQVLEIRASFAAGENSKVLCRRYKVSHSAMEDIRRGKSWKWI